jgi:hypothetical protein
MRCVARSCGGNHQRNTFPPWVAAYADEGPVDAIGRPVLLLVDSGVTHHWRTDLGPEHLAGLNWLSALLLERRRKCAEDLDGKVRATFQRTAERLEERLAIMRSEHNLGDPGDVPEADLNREPLNR